MAVGRLFTHPDVQQALRREPPPGAGRVRRFLARVRPPRFIKLTREGKYFIGITFGVGFAAVNTGNNLLYLLLGMLLSLIIVSGVMSELSLRAITVVRRLPPRAQVARPHMVEIEVYNHKRRVPSYAIEIEDLRAGQPADKRCFFLKISPRSAQIAAYRRTPARRGRDHHIGFRVATRFPFGLFEKSRELAADGELIIYPAVDAVKLPALSRGRHEGQSGALSRGGGDEIFSLRNYREGDDPRDIYWRKSAGPQLVMRERAEETQRTVEQVLDVYQPAGGADDAWRERFERNIREIASRSVAHLKRGDAVLVRTTYGERARADGSQGADPILRFLALVEPAPALAAMGGAGAAASVAAPASEAAVASEAVAAPASEVAAASVAPVELEAAPASEVAEALAPASEVAATPTSAEVAAASEVAAVLVAPIELEAAAAAPEVTVAPVSDPEAAVDGDALPEVAAVTSSEGVVS
ncbi:MAG: DUF58 domain-containing protein [Polyangiaceae bacterium]|nr:DUF58 domain-containing protein [Polyangiaceae bacterium]MCW5790067.1 DUF58 domain-containing protein [Polyangiaceae bacterium]